MTTRKITDAVEMLAALAEVGAEVLSDETGLAGVLGPSTTPAAEVYRLGEACSRWGWVLTWGLNAARYGYRWVACDVCRRLILAEEDEGSCLTTSCPGTTRTIPLPRFLPDGVRRTQAKTQAQ